MKKQTAVEIELYSNTELPTKHGDFNVSVFRNNMDDKEHLVIRSGEIGNGENLPVRIHSECLTSEVLGSLKCDCNEQLETALQYISRHKNGLIIYLRQEGRGLGLGNKIRAYALQEKGYDTVDANHLLGFPDDLRRYDIGARILKSIGVKSVQLMTNNPQKIAGLEENGIAVNRRIPIQVPHNPINHFYLKTKARKSNHLLELEENTLPQDLVTKTNKAI